MTSNKARTSTNKYMQEIVNKDDVKVYNLQTVDIHEPTLKVICMKTNN